MITEIELLNEVEAIGEEFGKEWAKAAPREQAKRLLASRLRSANHSLRPATVIRLVRLEGFDLGTMLPQDTDLRDSFLEGFTFGASMEAITA